MKLYLMYSVIPKFHFWTNHFTQLIADIRTQ